MVMVMVGTSLHLPCCVDKDEALPEQTAIGFGLNGESEK